MTYEVLRYVRSARIEPQPAGCHRVACCIDEPGTVALTGHADGYYPTREVRDSLAELAQRRRCVGPSARQVLLDPATGSRVVVVRQGCNRDLLTRRREGDGLDHGGPGIDADENIAGHIGLPPCAMMLPVSAAKRCRSVPATSKGISSPTRAAMR